jgi:hypothetical protein
MEPEVALRVVAPRIFQCVGDVLGLHTLCGDHASEVVAETDERTHDGAILLVARQVGEERPVDLDLRHFGGAELGQVREIHPEVVHGYRDALVGERTDDCSGQLGIERQRSLADLQVEPVGWHARLVQNLADAACELRRREVSRRDIDGDRPVVAGRCPGCVVGECSPQHPGRQGFDQVAALRDSKDT